jgi:hypothetical protein
VTTLTASRLVARPLTALKLMAMRVGEALGTFSPASLFSDGEEGALFDLSDSRLLFQDVNVMEPVVSVGDPIGLALDTSQGLRSTGPALGPELVTSFSDFGSVNGSDGTSTIVDGMLQVEASAGDGIGAVGLELSGLVVGETYVVRVDVDSSSENDARPGLRLGIAENPSSNYDVLELANTGSNYGAPKTEIGYFTYTGGTLYASIGVRNAGSTSAEWVRLSKFSVRRVIPISERFSGLGDDVWVTPPNTLGTGWSNDGGGVYSVDGTQTDNSNLRNTGILTIGRTYLVNVTVDAFPAGGLFFDAGGSTFSFTATGGYQFIVTPFSGTAAQVTAVAGTVATVSNISIRPLPGNHATQPTSTARPLYGRYPAGGRRNELNATASLATQNVTVTATQRTLSFKGTGTVTLSGTSTAGPLVGTGADDRVTLTFTPTAGALTLTVSGSVTDAQLELGSTATPYQRVAGDYDITEDGVRTIYGAYFDGVDDYLVTPSIDFTGVDEITLAAAVSREDTGTNNIFFAFGTGDASARLFANEAANTNAGFYSRGVTDFAVPVAQWDGSPASFIGRGDISQPLATLDVSFAVQAQDTSSQGGGNYGTQVLSIGASPTGSSLLVGLVSVAVLLDRYITDEETTALAGYLEEKAGV